MPELPIFIGLKRVVAPSLTGILSNVLNVCNTTYLETLSEGQGLQKSHKGTI